MSGFYSKGNVGFWFYVFSSIYPAVAVGMWESQAAFWRDFSKPRWEATLLVAFLGGVISIAG